MATTTTKPPAGRTTSRPAPPPLKPAEPRKDQQVAVLLPPRLPYLPSVKEEFGITENDWRALVEAVFPGALSAAAVNMALAYCKHRKLDIFKRPVHIVPIYSTALRKKVETVWPGIAEVRTTAMRTGSYAGLDKPTFGDKIEVTFTGYKKKDDEGYGDSTQEKIEVTVEFPEWCEITVWRFVQGQRVPFPGPRVEWVEIFSRMSFFLDVPNDRWQKAPVQMLEKCAEAAALRRAFPEELGDEFAAEEVEGMSQRAVDITGSAAAATSTPTTEPRKEDFKDKPAAQQGAAEPEKAKPADPKAEVETPEKTKADNDPKTKAGATDVADLNEVDPKANQGLDDPTPEGEAQDDADWPIQHARPGQQLKFTPFESNSDFMAFAEDFLPKTNALGAQQFLDFYDNDKIAPMGNSGIKVRMEAASWILATAKEIIDPPDSKKTKK